LHDGEEIFETLSSPPRPRDVSMDFETALEKLPDGAREIFVLHDVEGYKHHEIAAMLEISSGTSKAQLHRARMMLRKHLK
jgi:RNA polymerase sigma-70 factor (ECF subfamily)